MAKNGVIGSANSLPWHIPEDLKFFKEKTRGHILIMGRKTFASLGKPLPHRLHIVISRQPDFAPPGIIRAHSLAEACLLAHDHIPPNGTQWPEEVFICGGGEIYRESMSRVDRIYLTRIEREFPGDTYYPAIDLKQFSETARREVPGEVPLIFLQYDRKA